VRFEAELRHRPEAIIGSSARLSTRDGNALWTVTVPANGTATLRYKARDEE
jgi:hypothetical protein